LIPSHHIGSAYPHRVRSQDERWDLLQPEDLRQLHDERYLLAAEMSIKALREAKPE
jgi:hypothetical protein